MYTSALSPILLDIMNRNRKRREKEKKRREINHQQIGYLFVVLGVHRVQNKYFLFSPLFGTDVMKPHYNLSGNAFLVLVCRCCFYYVFSRFIFTQSENCLEFLKENEKFELFSRKQNIKNINTQEHENFCLDNCFVNHLWLPPTIVLREKR